MQRMTRNNTQKARHGVPVQPVRRAQKATLMGLREAEIMEKPRKAPRRVIKGSGCLLSAFLPPSTLDAPSLQPLLDNLHLSYIGGGVNHLLPVN
ncbi:hypothetical protein Pmani_005312 [Petrolisthes manimaculis]|uniref:Uncharacterized protein n=1 Tax=Petrolisthes manimaculis TaxID=1843537 RepID=A0AAE1QBZ2_9EUCA|nr:hypothetical protein Pmani_005312 [Petrolisthes manimaculis]